MVAGSAAADAVRRAKRMPGLRVGLHVVLVEGSPILPSSAIPDLVGQGRQFRTDMARFGLDIALRPAVRRQLRAEIAAQFDAYRSTGLPLDHVNAHKHFHLHPFIGRAIIEIGARYDMRAIRIPGEPHSILERIEPGSASPAWATAPWAALLKARARRAHLTVPEAVFGLGWTGAMTAPRVAGILAHLPPGIVEIYTHPAVSNSFSGHALGYRYTDELAALTDASVKQALRSSGYRLGGFSDLRAG